MKLPVGSTSRDILIASDVARSWLAGVIAKIKQFGCRLTSNLVNHIIFYQMFEINLSMSLRCWETNEVQEN